MNRDKHSRRWFCLFLVFLTLAPLAYGESYAAALKTEYQYTVKAACSLLGTFDDISLSKGIYRTLINIHNPTDKTITFAHKIALALGVGEEAGKFNVSPYKKAALGPDGAVQVNCGNIAGAFCPIDGVCIDFSSIDGFVVLNSAQELDVVVIYTARPSEGEVQTMDVETVLPRKIRKKIEIQPEQPPGDIKEHIKR
jgi:hypothetical protein